MVLVDTTVWSLAYRRRRETLSNAELHLFGVLKDLIFDSEVVLLGMVRQELLSGIRDETQYLRVRNDMRFFPDEPTSSEDHEEAARVSNMCRSIGIAGNPVDFLICAISLRRNSPVLTLDRDFVGYASCVAIQLYPIVSP